VTDEMKQFLRTVIAAVFRLTEQGTKAVAVASAVEELERGAVIYILVNSLFFGHCKYFVSLILESKDMKCSKFKFSYR
jgi:hypothetical protein